MMQVRVAPHPFGATFVRRKSMDNLYQRVKSHQWPGRLLWLGILVLHAVCCLFYTSAAYIYIGLPSTLLAVNLQAFQLTIDMKYFPVAAAFHLFFGCLHASLFLSMAVSSALLRRFNFKLSEHHTPKNRWLRGLLAIWQAVFGPLGVFGVDNPNFEALFMMRELMETALQSFQAYRMSQYVPRIWLNNVWVVIITMSCWGPPLLHRVPRLRRRTQLLLALLCDVLLDFTVSVGSPAVLSMSYIPDYDSQTQDFIADVWYSDLWYVNMVNEFRLIFIQSWFDGVTRVISASSLLLCLDDIKILASTLEPSTRARQSVAKLSFVDRPEVVTMRKSVVKGGRRVLVIWGLVLLTLHIEAVYNKSIAGCQLQVRPWLSTGTACSFLLIDCQEMTVHNDSAVHIEDAWQQANPNMLTLVTIQNCPSLVLPPSVQQFHNLMGLNIVASSLTSWDVDAALTKTAHPNMRHLGLLSVNFSSFGSGNGSVFPPGMVSPEFPPTLFDIFVWDCGWADLPANLDTIWPKRTNLLIPNNRMTHVPDVVMRMNPIRLMLDENPLVELPAELFEMPALESIEVAYTTLQTFPPLVNGLPSNSKLRHVHMHFSNISTLPSWMTTTSFLGSVGVQAEGTPLCSRIAMGDPAMQDVSGRLAC